MRTLFLFGFIAAFLSCNSDDAVKNNLSALTLLKGESGISYMESKAKWGALKSKNGNSYVYQTSFSSWAGFGSTTELRIEDGKVTQRVFEAYTFNNNSGEKQITDSYTETGQELGKNENGAPLFTIDDLYNSCAGEYLQVDEDTNTLFFETELNGLMTLCGFVPKNCADDCYTGVRINAFDWIN